MLDVPTIILSYLAPDEGTLQDAVVQRDQRPAASPPTVPMGEPKPDLHASGLDGLGRPIARRAAVPALLATSSSMSTVSAVPFASLLPEPPPLPEAEESPPAPQLVDENAAHIELLAPPFLDSPEGHGVAIGVTLRNSGRRATAVAFRSHMIGFRVEGPDGVVRCAPGLPGAPLVRESYQTLKPGQELTLPVIVAEACGVSLFHRPGLYKLTPSVTLSDSGASHGLAAFTGRLLAKAPTLVRVQAGDEPFYRSSPTAVKTRVDDDAP
jgi:hypothetical protein